MFLGTLDKVYIVDKTENNPTTLNGHPAWASGKYFLLLNKRKFDANEYRVLYQYESGPSHGRSHELVLCCMCHLQFQTYELTH